jgi:hypothetical protein
LCFGAPIARRNNRKEQNSMDGHSLARILGYASIALGVPPLTMPRFFARSIGIHDVQGSATLAPLVGARELASAVGILAEAQSLPWVWARVAGDAMDIVLLLGALASPHARRNRVGVALAAVLAITALDVRCALQLRDQE